MSSLKVDNITGRGNAGFTGSVKSDGGNTTTDLQQGLAKAWQIAGTDASVTDSFNTSANNDNGTGDHQFNIVSNMSSANYAINATAAQTTDAQPVMSCNPSSDINTSSLFRLQVGLTTSGAGDYAHLDKVTYMSIHGDLA